MSVVRTTATSMDFDPIACSSASRVARWYGAEAGESMTTKTVDGTAEGYFPLALLRTTAWRVNPDSTDRVRQGGGSQFEVAALGRGGR